MTKSTQVKLRWASRILLGLAGILGIVAVADVQLPAGIAKWLALGAAVLGYASRWCEQQLPAVGGGGPGVLPVLLVLVLAGCGANLTNGYRAVRITEKAGEATDTILGAWIRTTAISCRKRATTRGAFDKCFARAKQAGVQWTDRVRPSINVALAATWAGLEVARRHRAECNWIQTIRPAICALLEILRELQGMVPKLKPIAARLAGVEEVICHE